ncbi:MAG TPA: DUF5667 domain-containing protein [Egibacteraceae bacterium]|nr:DUF5667 domain-containing protein [Egibacteraceae bacterium]
MTPTDVDALARLLDGDPTLNGEVTEESRALGRLAHVLATAKPVPARPEFKAALRAKLVDAAREQARVPALTRMRTGIGASTARWRYSTRAAAATGAAALALSSGGLAVAADRALPSDVLYPAKLVIEDVRIALVRDDVSRGAAHLAQASTRISEAEAAAGDGNQAGAAVALLKADEALRTGAGELLRAYTQRGDASSVERLADFTDQQRARLARLDDLLAGEAAEAARILRVAFERIEARMMSVVGACEGCEGATPEPRPGADLADIPPAHEAFEECPCDLGPSGGDAGTVDAEPPGPSLDGAPEAPPVQDMPPAATDTPSVQPPAEAPTDDPGVPQPDPNHEPPPLTVPDLPSVAEPRRSSDSGVVDAIVRGVLHVLLP